jgi:hypothetical protein
MEIRMKRLALAFAATVALSAPTLAMTMDVMLPTLTFPEDTVVPSTKGSGDRASAPVVQSRE